MSVTVIIPTHDRADMLREALESVARQSAIKAIDAIMVSENGESSASMRVCLDFPQLNIDYRKRAASSAHDHGKLIREDLFEIGVSKYTAILHDDDFWAPGHLASAIHALDSIPAATFYGSCHFDVRDAYSMLSCTHNFYAWFGSNFASLNCAWVIPPENAVLTCILGCVCHYSTMVMRTEAFKKASSIYDEPDANFDSDVRLQFALSQLGPIIYNPMPMVFTRHHEDRDCVANFTDDERIRYRRLTTAWIIKNFDVKKILDKFCAGYDACPPMFKGNCAGFFAMECCLPEIKRYMKKNGMTYDKELPGVQKIVRIAP